MKFQKTYQYVNAYEYKEVTDACLLKTLIKLQEKYDFEIISYNFQDCFDDSYIIIKCDKKDKQNIFMSYYIMLHGKIEQISG